MGHMTSRGWTAKTPAISSTDAAEFKARCLQSHTAQWKVNITRWSAGTNHTLATDVPIVRGELTIDSSDPIRRKVSLELGVGEEWIPKNATSPLVPFGQVVHLYVRIDRTDGSWFPWFKVFEGPIQSSIFERPSLINTIEAADFSQTVDDFLHLRKRSYTNMTLHRALTKMVDDALPGAIYEVDSSTVAQKSKVTSFVAEAGQSRLEAANELAGKHSQEIFFDGLGRLCIRKDISDEDDDSWNPSEPGPDIGTVSNPVAKFSDGEGGNLLGVTASITREGAINGVQINRTALVNKRRKGKKKAKKKEIWWSHFEGAGGTVAYGDAFGRLPLVETKSVKKLTAAVKARGTSRSKHLLQRRRGLLRYLDFDSLPLYWCEADDKVSITVNGETEYHFIQRVTLDLAGGPMRVRTRTLAVTDPGDLG